MPTMPVLVATDRTQGQRASDFLAPNVILGELVDISSSCDTDRGQPDGGCGCCRSFTGLTSRYATTTAEVVMREMTLSQYVQEHLAGLVNAGLPTDPTTRRWAEEAARDMARIAADFPPGTVVERRGDDILERLTEPRPGHRTRPVEHRRTNTSCRAPPPVSVGGRTLHPRRPGRKRRKTRPPLAPLPQRRCRASAPTENGGRHHPLSTGDRPNP